MIQTNFVKIPKNISIYIHPKKKFLLIKSNYNKVLIKINFIVFKVMRNNIEFLHILSYNQKNLNHKKSVTVLKRALIEVSFKSFKRLKLNGIGYKFSIIPKLSSIIHLKLGYSHSVYFKLPEYVTAKLTKNNILFLFSNSNEKLLTIAEAIKSCKIPDPYKGKGIMYINEKINLKVGKKL